MTTKTVLTDEQIQQAAQCLTSEVSIDGDSLVLKNVNGCVRAIEQAVLQSPEVRRLREMAEFGKVALQFDKRARWHHEGDPAESVCNEFAQAMKDAFGEIVETEKQS